MELSKREIEGKKGIALIMALWIMTILLVVAASFAFMMRTEIRMAKNYRDGVKAHYLALAGVEHAIAKLRADNATSPPNYIKTDSLHEDWFVTFYKPGSFGYSNAAYDEMVWEEKWFLFGEGGYQVRLIDEAGMHNINAMEGGILHPTSLVGLESLLEEGDGKHVAATDKACRIRDYRDSDETAIDSTSDGDGWEGTGCKNYSYYDTLREIQKVKDINVDDDYPLDGINNNPLTDHGNELTVYSEDPDKTLTSGSRLNINTLSEEDILTALTAANVEPHTAGWPDAWGYYWIPCSLADSAAAIVARRASIPFETVGKLVEAKLLPWSYKCKYKCPDCNYEFIPCDATVCPECDATPITPVEVTFPLTVANTDKRDKNMKRLADIFTVAPSTANAIYYKPAANPNLILGPININTAPKWALCSLFDIDVAKAIYIIETRHGDRAPVAGRSEGASQSTTFTYGVADTGNYGRGEIMLTYYIGGGKPFADCSDQVTVRSDRFRIVSTGKVKDVSNNVIAARKIEVVVDRDYHDDGTMGPITILYWTEKVFED